MRNISGINSGELRHRVNFYSQTYTEDGYGGKISTESLYYSCWAKVSHKSGARLSDQNQMVLMNNWEIIIRKNDEKPIQKTFTIEYDGYDLIIDSIIDMEEFGRFIKIIAFQRN